MATQLTLGITLADDATFHNFYAGDNQQVVRCLDEMARGVGEHIIYLWGQRDVGTTHLLQACCHRAFEHGSSAIFLPLSESCLTPEIFQDLETVDLVCVDDLALVLGKPEWEEALLHLYNRVRDRGSRLVIGAKQTPYLTTCKLADLRSRLAWGLVLRIDPLQDQQKLAALQMRIRGRGLEASMQAASFLLKHYACDMKTLFCVLDKLDKMALIEKRRLTIPFIKQALRACL